MAEAMQGLRQLADVLNIETARISGDPQRLQLALGESQSRKLQEAGNLINAEIDKLDVPPTMKALAKSLPPTEQMKLLFPGMGTGKTTFERMSIISKESGQPVGSILKSEAELWSRTNKDPSLQLAPFTGIDKGQEGKEKIYQIIGPNNERLDIGTYADYQEGMKSGTYAQGSTIVNIPTGTEAPEVGKKGKPLFSAENKPFAQRWEATDSLQSNLQNYANEIAKSEEAALSGVAGTANFVNSFIQNTQGFLSMASNDTNNFYNESIKENDFITSDGKDFSERVKSVSNQYNINESQVRDLAYLFAAARGQEGRGLSDKDYENALRIVSGGVGREGKIAVVRDVYNRLGGQIERTVDNRIRALNGALSYADTDADKDFLNTQINELQNLKNATAFSPFVNPLKIPGSNDSLNQTSANDPFGIRVTGT